MDDDSNHASPHWLSQDLINRGSNQAISTLLSASALQTSLPSPPPSTDTAPTISLSLPFPSLAELTFTPISFDSLLNIDEPSEPTKLQTTDFELMAVVPANPSLPTVDFT